LSDSSTQSKLKQEIDKISAMDRAGKWSYFQTYYMKPTLVIVFFLVLLIWFIKDTAFQKEGICNGCIYNVAVTDEQKEWLTTGYLDYYGYDQKKYDASVSTDYMFEDTAQQMDAYAHEMALYAQVAAGDIQYMILDKDTLDYMSNGGIYADLNTVLSEETMHGLEGMTIELHDDESSEDYEAAIDLVRLGVFDESVGEAYLIFTPVQKDQAFAENFIKYLVMK